MFILFQVNGVEVSPDDTEGITICITPPSPNRSTQNLLETPDDEKKTFENSLEDKECVCLGHKADGQNSYSNHHIDRDDKSTADIDQDNAYKHSDSVMGNIFEIDVPLKKEQCNSLQSEPCDTDQNNLEKDEDEGSKVNKENSHREVEVTVHVEKPEQMEEAEKQEKLRNIVNYMQNQALASKAKAYAEQTAQNKSNCDSNCSIVKSESSSKLRSKQLVRQEEKINLIEEDPVKGDNSESEVLSHRKSAKEFREELERNKKEKEKIKKKEQEEKKHQEKSKNRKSKQSENGIIEKGFKKFTTDAPVFIDPNEGMDKKNKDFSGVQMRPKSSPQKDGNHDISGRGTANRESWAKRKLRTSLKKSLSLEKEKEKESTAHNHDEKINEVITNRWRLVLNVQKFQSKIQQPQMMTPFPQSKQPLSAKISNRIVSRQVYLL